MMFNRRYRRESSRQVHCSSQKSLRMRWKNLQLVNSWVKVGLNIEHVQTMRKGRSFNFFAATNLEVTLFQRAWIEKWLNKTIQPLHINEENDSEQFVRSRRREKRSRRPENSGAKVRHETNEHTSVIFEAIRELCIIPKNRIDNRTKLRVSAPSRKFAATGSLIQNKEIRTLQQLKLVKRIKLNRKSGLWGGCGAGDDCFGLFCDGTRWSKFRATRCTGLSVDRDEGTYLGRTFVNTFLESSNVDWFDLSFKGYELGCLFSEFLFFLPSYTSNSYDTQTFYVFRGYAYRFWMRFFIFQLSLDLGAKQFLWILSPLTPTITHWTSFFSYMCIKKAC